MFYQVIVYLMLFQVLVSSALAIYFNKKGYKKTTNQLIIMIVGLDLAIIMVKYLTS